MVNKITSITLLLLFMICHSAFAFETFAVTTAPEAQCAPDIYGDIVVWHDYRDGKADIWAKDLSEGVEFQITNLPSQQSGANIYGDYIVWNDSRNGNVDVYAYNLNTHEETQITTNMYGQWTPKVYNNYIVWTDERNNTITDPQSPFLNYDVYAYNLDTQEELQITTNEFKQKNPVIYDNNIYFMDFRNRNWEGESNYDDTKEEVYGEIWGYDLFTENEFCLVTMPSFFSTLAAYGNIIVWQDGRSGTNDIRAYDIVTNEEFLITSDEAYQWFPGIFENIVVWSDRRNGEWDIYGYDLVAGGEFPISLDPNSRKYDPAIWGNTIVWEEYNILDNSWDIYGAVIPEPSTILLLTTGLVGVVGLGLKRKK